MDGFGGGTTGYWKNRYYTRLDADVDGHDYLHGGAPAKPPSGPRRKPPSSRRPKVVKVSPPPPLSSTPHPAPPAAPGPASPFSVSSTSTGTAPTTSSSTRRLPTVPHGRRRRRFWRIRLPPRLAFLRRVASAPARLLRGIQRGYVRMMLRFAGAMGGGMGGYPMPRPALKEYDEKVLVEIYRALVAQGHVLVVPVPGAAGSEGAVTTATLVAR